ncbi:uncharacterized protein LOC111916108 [Lactuca sativa]|uniref:uncharacterized protein LOC111916108 n=1 Tax=Lactuca sativa TaxID=4236 RepID=UPI0022AF43FE|nr:uncharacterized protein LOC111916108 [Lactuca sativa]
MLTESFQAALLKGYRERKADAKEYFMLVGGYEDIPRAIANPPEGMEVDKWKKAVEYFQTNEHIIASEKNKKIREMQTNANRGGRALKQNLKRVETFRKAHTDKNDVFVTTEAEQQYLLEQTQGESQLTPTQERTVLEKVLGERRSHIRGIGHKPSTLPPIPQPSQPSPQPSQLENLCAMLNDPACRDELHSFFHSQNNRGNDGNEDDGM